ncbi:hypothetical protein HK102_012648, partial [Quaeritorhiza haematococci]
MALVGGRFLMPNAMRRKIVQLAGILVDPEAKEWREEVYKLSRAEEKVPAWHGELVQVVRGM